MKRKWIWLIALMMILNSCSVLKTFVNVSRLKFKIDNVNNFKVMGISISDKDQLSDFNVGEILQLTTSVASGDLPVSFTLNVKASNPNDGSGGYGATDITLKSFPWKLIINDKETISGNIDSSILVPGVGTDTNIPLSIQLDLLKFFKDKGYQEIVNLALKLGGAKGSPSNLKLIAKPVLGSPVGDLTYPDEITIISTEFN